MSYAYHDITQQLTNIEKHTYWKIWTSMTVASAYGNIDIFEDKFIKVFVERRNDYYAFDKFMDRLYKEISVTDLKVVEDFSDLSADLVHDDVVEGAQDTLSLLDRYVDEIETKLDKERIKSKLKSLYIESSDLEA